jgi:iron complex outermembrane receptor protein
MKRTQGILFGAALLALFPLGGPAAEGPEAAGKIEEIIVEATRIPGEANELPFAVSRVDRQAIQAARQQLGLDESLATVPGLFFQNRYNFAQDLRIAIRGFGARANFGIRGIRLFADDIPLTLPDGQGSVDAIDLGSADRIEVIRGPFSAVYGAASGGVIHIRTEDGEEPPFVSGRLNAGSYGYGQIQAQTGGLRGGLNWLANVSTTRLDGYRQHARYDSDLFNGKFRYDFESEASLTVVMNAVDSPQAEDPGALNAREVEQDRRQAAPRNLLFDAGEALDQQSLGLAFRKAFGGGRELMLRNYHVRRDFSNRLPFDVNSNGQGGSVALERAFSGLGGSYAWEAVLGSSLNRLIVGFDFDAQRDLRRRFANNQGSIGQLTTEQDEDVTAAGLYLQDVVELGDALRLTLGGRVDRVTYEISNRISENGSGKRRFTEFSPMAGLNWSLGPGLNLYGNLSQSFDPPATTELANPEGPTGFNPELEPQTATNFEMGIKGFASDRVRYELALFLIDVTDEIVPFELEGSGQSFFRNAGSSSHDGMESSVTVRLAPGLTGVASYTWSRFRYDRFAVDEDEVYDGNRIPGIPEHLFSLDLSWRGDSGLFAGFDLLYAGSFYADDANSVKAGDYMVSNLRLGYRWASGGWSLEPFVGVNNLLDEDYMANIRINASFGRYFEPAPERNAYGGFELSCGFR